MSPANCAGMGKSAVLSLFRDLGAITISSDEIVSELLREPKVVRQVERLLDMGF
ncbi:MAG: hypothetical protein WA610_12155 [Thermodesulfovibrionales bacterium]